MESWIVKFKLGFPVVSTKGFTLEVTKLRSWSFGKNLTDAYVIYFTVLSSYLLGRRLRKDYEEP
jgi:hypothetical protein